MHNVKTTVNKTKPHGVLFCAYACPSPYPEDTRSTRISFGKRRIPDRGCGVQAAGQRRLTEKSAHIVCGWVAMMHAMRPRALPILFACQADMTCRVVPA